MAGLQAATATGGPEGLGTFDFANRWRRASLQRPDRASFEAVVSARWRVLRARNSGPFIVRIFTAPEPPRVGPVDVAPRASRGGGVLTARSRYPHSSPHRPSDREPATTSGAKQLRGRVGISRRRP